MQQPYRVYVKYFSNARDGAEICLNNEELFDLLFIMCWITYLKNIFTQCSKTEREREKREKIHDNKEF